MVKEITCEGCGMLKPASRVFFPWGSRKPKYCGSCINYMFSAILDELSIDFKKIEEEESKNV